MKKIEISYTTNDQLKNHPDFGGDTATMQAINAEYEEWTRSAANTAPPAFPAPPHPTLSWPDRGALSPERN